MGRLETRVEVAEAEGIRGLPLPPEPLRTAVWEGSAGFRLRRIESTAAAHIALKAGLEGRLAQLSGRASEGEDGPEARNLRSRFLLLGQAPEREAGLKSDSGGDSEAFRRALDKARGESAKRRTRPRVIPLLLARAAGTDDVPAQEMFKRKAVARTKFYGKLIINGNDIGATKEVGLGADFSLDFNSVFSIRIIWWPEQAHLQVFERGLLFDTFVADVFISVPGGDGRTLGDPLPVSYQFTSQTPSRAAWVLDDTIFCQGAVYVKSMWLPMTRMPLTPTPRSGQGVLLRPF